MMNHLLLLTGMALPFLISPVAHAYTLSLRPVADTALFENGPDNNLGAQTFMPVGRTGVPSSARGLMRFDLSELPTNAVVTSVTLRISSVFGGGGTQTYDLHSMLQPWTEGIRSGGPNRNGGIGAAAGMGETTWNSRAHGSIPWASPGGAPGVDFAVPAIASADLTGSGSRTATFSSDALTADVLNWAANPSNNFGWLLKDGAETASGTARRIASRENAANAPLLTITYSAPGPTVTNNSPLPFGDIDLPFTFTFGATGGIPPYVWASAGTLPRGLTFSSAGILSGTPTNAGSFTFAVRPTDAVGVSTSKTVSVTIDARPFLSSISASNGNVLVGFTALSNRQYAIEHRDAVATGSWMTLTNLSVPTNQTITVVDSITEPRRFFRLRKN